MRLAIMARDVIGPPTRGDSQPSLIQIADQADIHGHD
jgi:hypothetical protein